LNKEAEVVSKLSPDPIHIGIPSIPKNILFILANCICPLCCISHLHAMLHHGPNGEMLVKTWNTLLDCVEWPEVEQRVRFSNRYCTIRRFLKNISDTTLLSLSWNAVHE
jgi:hypothetical protein